MGIGTEREGNIHRALKFRYTGIEGETEVPRGGYVCDGISSYGEMIEVQTGSFGPLKEKIPELLRLGPVRLIHPVIISKIIETRDSRKKLIRRRKSPRKGTAWDLFKALVYAPELPRLKGLTLEIAPVDVLEKRILDGKGSWRRKGASITDKSIAEYHESIVLSGLKEYRQFVPFKKTEIFTVRGLAEKTSITPEIAGKTLYVLTKLNITERVGKEGNAWVYRKK
ncbi:hypothetical protein [Treponema primitia]|uniref:hypothetical protein n=1 Tax=Treponema primitia TaxID=88058 RepID=UPI0002D92CCA|nr:hypothetical protein [Treponema primitia]